MVLMAKRKMTPYSDDDIDNISSNILDLDDDLGDISKNVLDLDEDPGIKRPIISSEPPKSGTGKVKSPKISPEALDRLPSKKYANRTSIISAPTLPPPGSIGGVSMRSASPRGATSPKKKASTLAAGTVTKSYPKPLPFMYDTHELNKLRPLPVSKGSILSTGPATAAISAAPGSPPSAVASAVATTPAGASTAVKSFIKNKASSVSGSSVIRKFANRKSIAVGGLAAAGLATSIATSKNRLQNQEQRR